MFIQGDLQVVFDALYTMGVIDPVLKADWQVLNQEINENPYKLVFACEKVNQCLGDKNKILDALLKLDSKSIQFLAIEVAREFSEFQSRETLH